MPVENRGADCEVIHEEVVELVRAKMPAQSQLLELAGFYKVMGDGTRMRLLWALEQHEMCVCDLAVLLDMTKSAVSHQLSALRNAKLVRHRREGKHIFYSLSDDHVKSIIEMGFEHICERKNCTTGDHGSCGHGHGAQDTPA